jgi:hypothetical protein
MSDAPTRVVLYSFASGAPRAAAEFRWTPGAAVSLTVLDPEWGSLAERYYQQGVPYDIERRVVPPSESETFMRALVQPKSSTYSRFVDESGDSPADEEQ